MKYIELEDINEYKSESINPAKMQEMVFELYSVPVYETGHPEYLTGKQIASSKIVVRKNDILLCKINPRINRVWIVKKESENVNIASSEWIVVRSNKYNPEFLAWYFRSPKFRQLMVSEVTGIGGSLTRAQPKRVAKYPVPVIDRNIQDKIVYRLNKIYNIIDMKKRELAKFDSLIQARFVEMFGDPVQNTKGWSIDTCKNLTSKIGSGATPKGGRESYCTEGIAFVRSMNVYNNRFEYGDLAFINDEQANKLSNVTVEHKDVLLKITGASVARCCIVPDELIPARVNQHVAIVRCKEKILPEFLCSMFTEDNYQKLLWRIATSGGATREAITKQQIENLVLIVPPMKLQEDYVRFSERVNKSKFVIHKFLYCTTHNTQSIIKPRPNTKESGKTRGGKPYADEF